MTLKTTFYLCIASILTLQTINSQESHYEVRKLSSNSDLADFGVTIINENKVVFASAMGFSGDKTELDDNGKPFLNMYSGTLTTEKDISNIAPIKPWIDLNFHITNPVFTKDGKTVYFTASNIEKGRLKRSKKQKKNLIQLYRASVSESGDWTNVEKLPFNDDKYQTGHPALSADDSILFFISDRPESTGRTDIFSVFVFKDGTFSEPKNLGPSVNTDRREMFPYVDPYTNKLYFASDGQENTLGGLDIYAVNLEEDEVKSGKPYHFENPINTYWDDYAFTSFSNGTEGYLSSNRFNVEDDNIYYFKYVKTDNCDISGTISAEGLDDNLEGTQVTLYNASGNQLGTVITNAKGNYTFTLPCQNVQGQTFTIKAEKAGFGELITQIIVNNNGTMTDANGNPVSNNLTLISNDFVGGSGNYKLDIDPIYFDYGSPAIKEHSVIEIEKVVRLLNKYPKLKISIESHTDTRSSSQFNQRLSEQRAKTVYNWLVSRGVNTKRLDYKGYGESKPLNKCVDNVPCTELEHLVNRRTEFVIVK